MKERLFLRRIAGQCGYVVCWYAQVPALIETDFADAAFTLFDETTVSACVTLKGIIRQVFGQFRGAFGSHCVEDCCKRSDRCSGYRHCALYFVLCTWYFVLCTWYFEPSILRT